MYPDSTYYNPNPQIVPPIDRLYPEFTDCTRKSHIVRRIVPRIGTLYSKVTYCTPNSQVVPQIAELYPDFTVAGIRRLYPELTDWTQNPPRGSPNWLQVVLWSALESKLSKLSFFGSPWTVKMVLPRRREPHFHVSQKSEIRLPNGPRMLPKRTRVAADGIPRRAQEAGQKDIKNWYQICLPKGAQMAPKSELKSI